MSTPQQAIDSVKKYLARLKLAKNHDQEILHCFDAGESSETELKVSDVRALVRIAEAAPNKNLLYSWMQSDRTPEEFTFGMRLLNWNRAQQDPPIEICRELWVADEIYKMIPKPNADDIATDLATIGTAVVKGGERIDPASIYKDHPMTEDQRFELIQKVTDALRTVDRIANDKERDVGYETIQKSGFNRKTGWRRNYTLADARGDARNAAIQLRAAWEMLEPISKGHTNDSQPT